MTVDETLKDMEQQQPSCSLVIVHETDESLKRAMSLCERIMSQMWEDLDIQMAHWPMRELIGRSPGEEATANAANADILVVAAGSDPELPREFWQWTERWLAERQGHEGALVGLFEEGSDRDRRRDARDRQLHQLALRAGMDYLNRLPDTPPHGIPDNTGWCASRAGEFTGTLDQIIRSDPGLPGH